MKQEELKRLISRINSDPAFTDSLRFSASLDAAVELARAAGFDVAASDWDEFEELFDLELSMEQLSSVSGGCFSAPRPASPAPTPTPSGPRNDMERPPVNVAGVNLRGFTFW